MNLVSYSQEVTILVFALLYKELLLIVFQDQNLHSYGICKNIWIILIFYHLLMMTYCEKHISQVNNFISSSCCFLDFRGNV